MSDTTFRMNLKPQMIANLRFAYSPILELTTSFRVLRGNWKQATYYQWIEEAQQAIYDLELPYMTALITPGYGVEFNSEGDYQELRPVMELPN